MKSVCITIALVFALCGVCAAATLQSTDAKAGKAVKSQTACPVMEGKIDKKYHADYQGKRVYFCCEGCVKEFEKGPSKYVKKLEDQGVTLEKAPAVAVESTGAK